MYHAGVPVIVVQPPQTLLAPEGVRVTPWVELSGVVAVRIAEWCEQESWLAATAPVVAGQVQPARAVPWTPRHARLPGAPPPARLAASFSLAAADAEAVASEILAALRLTMYWQPELRVASRPGESLPAFRKRLLAALRDGPLARSEDSATRAEVAARLAHAIVARPLAAGELVPRRLAIGTVYYPEGFEPAPPPEDLMLTGVARPWR